MGIIFCVVFGGYEFIFLLMVVLNVDGKGKNFLDEFIIRCIKVLQGVISLIIYLFFICINCFDVV